MELYPYQNEGAAFLAERPRAFLGDEQGLGKTVQAIRAADTVGAQRVHIVCPAVARPVWRREIPRWSLLGWDFLVQSYDLLVASGQARAEAARFGADTLIFDEAHYLKNPTAKRTRWGYSGANQRRWRVWGLSGTLMPNHPGELWTHAKAAGLTDLSHRQWEDRYCHITTDMFNGRMVRRIRGAKRNMADELRELFEPVYLRRRSSDVLDLPPIRWGLLPVEAKGPDVRELFQDMDPAILQALESGDTEQLARVMPELPSLRRGLGILKAAPVAEMLLEEMEATDAKTIVFAWHRDVLDILERDLAKLGVVRIDGSTSDTRRQEAVERFQNGAPRIFLGQTAAAGTAITLTAANRVVFVESDWVPANISQAAKRAHRIGQDRSVLVQTAILPGTADELVQQALTRKARDISLIME